jgi:hypothetical protein
LSFAEESEGRRSGRRKEKKKRAKKMIGNSISNKLVDDHYPPPLPSFPFPRPTAVAEPSGRPSKAKNCMA